VTESEPAAKIVEQQGELAPLPVSTARIIMWGISAWLLALIVTVAVPGLHQGERSWWPWTCVTGIALGVFGYAYVRRGRGNARDAA
jgi:hypothetical protein